MSIYGDGYLNTLGVAQGWTTNNAAGEWRWSAYGPRGRRNGTAANAEEAAQRARAAYDDLTRP